MAILDLLSRIMVILVIILGVLLFTRNIVSALEDSVLRPPPFGVVVGTLSPGFLSPFVLGPLGVFILLTRSATHIKTGFRVISAKLFCFKCLFDMNITI